MMTDRTSRLLVIVPDRVSDIIVKGEYQPDYYNPGQIFDEVHLLMTNDDRPSAEAMQRTVGRARLVFHNLPERPDLVTANWRRWWKKPLRDWAAPGVELARLIDPHLIRCHGADWNTYLASRIRKALGIPYVVSLHINPDVNPVRRHVRPPFTPEQEAHNAFFEYLERTGLQAADLVMPVYKPILPYLERMGAPRVEVCYNVLNNRHLARKDDYARGERFRIVCVGRLNADKNPDNIIRAVARMPDAELTIVGDGPLRPELETLAASLGAAERVIFRPSVDNDELCRMLPGFDLFAVHTEYWEINKSVLEALLTGLPVVINRRRGPPVPEFVENDIVHFVDSSEDGYFAALSHFAASEEARADLGQRALTGARRLWDPAATTETYAEIYRRLMRKAG
jgi:glycosyltransferase involved in cell wall biosynthesis